MGDVNLSCSIKKPFFSIVMPLYNCADYIRAAIESIQTQSFQDYELIIIDDCSNDDSNNIAFSYAIKNPKIKIIKNKNKSGVSETRNIGMRNAKGNYFIFVDADDYLESDILEKINESIKRHSFDIIKFGYSIDFYDKRGKLIVNKIKKTDSFEVVDQAKNIKNLALEIEKKQIFGYVWNAAYSVNFIRSSGVLFDSTMKVDEDFIFNIDAFSKASSVKILDCVGYHYNKRKNVSLSMNVDGNNFPYHVRSIERMISFYDSDSIEASNVIRWLYTRTLYVNGCQLLYKKNKDFWCSVFQTDIFNSIYDKAKQYKISFMKDVLIRIMRTRNIALINTCCFFMLVLKKLAPSIFIRIKS